MNFFFGCLCEFLKFSNVRFWVFGDQLGMGSALKLDAVRAGIWCQEVSHVGIIPGKIMDCALPLMFLPLHFYVFATPLLKLLGQSDYVAIEVVRDRDLLANTPERLASYQWVWSKLLRRRQRCIPKIFF
jgi:hypothetical protein